MAFSKFLDEKRKIIKELVAELGKTIEYVSVLGTDVKATLYMADARS